MNMTEMRDAELIIILGFYYVGKEKNVDGFTALFNLYFGRDFSVQTILHEISIFKNINPVNNVNGSDQNSRYKNIWNEYIEKDKITDLKTLYKSFKSREFTWFLPKYEKIKGTGISNIKERTFEDKPKDIEYADINTAGYKRDGTVVDNALYAAGHICEGGCDSELFLKKDGRTNYTEAHHLIPLKFQPAFKYSLDVEANVVSLCPRCHRLLHNGIDNTKLIQFLYEKRKERLKKCLICISYEKLLLLYAGNFVSDDE